MNSPIRNNHLLGVKLRNIRKSNRLTLEDLSLRCSQIDPKSAPSVSYISMIENGKRLPSDDVLSLIANVFQKDESWFLDENLEISVQSDDEEPIKNIPLEPGFLYSKDLLQGAIPELLDQTGITGKQFAQLLIRSYQEKNQNRFPDIEKIADAESEQKLPIKVSDIRRLYKKHGLQIKWFNQNKINTNHPHGKNKILLRSFFDSNNKVYINEALKNDAKRLKYDMATHLGHKILHGGDGLRSPVTSGTNSFESKSSNSTVQSHDVLLAWHDFESSFFAGALLCPRKAFRNYLIKNEHHINAKNDLDLSPALLMRRITAVSQYPYWHYFEAYQPGFLTAVYRGNGIQLPWGNLNMVNDPCPNWAVFRLLNESYVQNPQSQISLLKTDDSAHLYACYSIRISDSAGNLKLYSLGLDLVPVFKDQGFNHKELLRMTEESCMQSNGESLLEGDVITAIEQVSHILKIGWIRDALASPARIICPRSSGCKREKPCKTIKNPYRFDEIDSLKENILLLEKAKLI